MDVRGTRGYICFSKLPSKSDQYAFCGVHAIRNQEGIDLIDLSSQNNIILDVYFTKEAGFGRLNSEEKIERQRTKSNVMFGQ